VKDSENGGGVLPGLTVFNNQPCLETAYLQPRLCGQWLAGWSLNRRKPERAAVVMAQEKLDPAVAQQELSIEHDNHAAASGPRSIRPW
jgi:hypothetical protein